MERNFEAQTEKVFGEIGETKNESTVVKMGSRGFIYNLFDILPDAIGVIMANI